MPSLPFLDFLKELRSRNLSVSAVYREWTKRLPPGPVTRLTASLAEQRLELGKALGEISADYGLHAVPVEFEFGPAQSAGAGSEDAEISDLKAILKKIVDAESAEHDLLATLAGAVVAASPEAAERLASEAESARKRSTWAQDQLDLLAMF